MWSLGAQIVAMNWQTPGPPMWVHQGMFADNGKCGFVKKPDWMLSMLAFLLMKLIFVTVVVGCFMMLNA